MFEDDLLKVDETFESYFNLRTFAQQIVPSKLLFLAGLPASGNNSLAIQLAVRFSVLHHQPTCYFSNELSAEIVRTMMVSEISSLPLDTVEKGSLSGIEFTQLLDGVGKLYNAPFYLIDSGQYDIDMLAADIRRLRAERNGEVFFIDYLGLISTRTNDIDRYPLLINRLQKLAEEENVAIVGLIQINRYQGPDLEAYVLSQLSRLGADKHPTLFVMKSTTEEGAKAPFPHLMLFNSDLPIIKDELGLARLRSMHLLLEDSDL